MSDYRNEEGEFLMTAAEMRFEAELDAESAYERSMDEDPDWFDEIPDPADCDHDGWEWNWSTGLCYCSWCEIRLPEHDDDFDGAPTYREGMGPGDPVRCDND